MALKVSDYNSPKIKPVGKRLDNITIYLDLKMYPGEANLSKNLKLLGAKVEPLFSRNVSLVITNKESARNALARPFKVPPKPQNWTPLTPITNTTCHSPLFLHESSTEYMDSPPYTNSPATDQNAIPMCRGMAMVKQAILKKKSQGPTDILEKCRQWNVKVKHVDDILQKVKKLSSQYIAQVDAEKKRTQNGERKLKPPFLKVEESKRRGTWYREFPSSTFDNKLADKVKELYNHFKKSGNIQVAIKPAQGEFSKSKCYPKSSMVQSPVPTQSLSKSISKFSETPKPSTAFSVCNVKRKISEHAPVASKKQKTSQGRKKKLYCEICKMNYVHLDKHLASENHRIFMSDPMNFLEIQNIILSLPKKEDFLSSRCPESSDSGQISNEVLLHSSQVFESTDNLPVYHPQEYLNTCGLLDKEFNPQQFDLKGIVPTAIEDLDTEPYSVIDQHYVSPSCTSPASRYLPYLEDSLDKVINESFARNDIDDTPLNLSNDGNRNFANLFPNNCNQPSYFKCPENVSIRESAVETLPTNALNEDITLNSACTLNEVASMSENMLIVSNKRKIDLNYIPPIENPSYEFGNEVLHKDVDEGKNSQQVSIVVEHTQKHCTQYFQCIDCTQENLFHCSQINSALPEDKTFENPSFHEKIQNIYNDSGISIRGSPPPELTLPDSLEEESDAAMVKLDECCALDLSTTKGLDIEMVSNTEAPKPTSNLCEETSAMPELSKEVVDNITIPDQSCEMSVGVPVPPLSPVVHGKECETNAAIIGTFGKPGELEMPKNVCEMECEASSEDTSPTTIVACEQVPSDTQNIPNESTVVVDSGNTEHPQILKDLHRSECEVTDHNADSSSEIACESVINEGINQSICSSNGFEAITVDIGIFGDFKIQHTLHGSEYEASLQNTSPFIHVTCEPSSETPNMELEGVETLPLLCKIEADAQNTDSSVDIACERISSEHKIIQQEAICSKNGNEANTFDNGTFGNSSCLDTSNILHCCKCEDSALNTHNTSSSMNVANKLIHIEPKNDQDAVICSSNVKSEFVHLCEEVSKSFNGIGIDLNTSEVSCYELVEEAEFDSSSECEWDNIHTEVDNLCLSLGAENDDTDPFTMCC